MPTKRDPYRITTHARTPLVLNLAGCLALVIIATTPVASETLEGLKIKRVRSFICRAPDMGSQQDVADIAGGDEKEKVFIRPTDDKCHFHLLYRSARGHETQLTQKPGGYLFARAIAVADGTRVICASDTVHIGAPDGKPNQRLSQQVPIRCWAGTGNGFASGDPVVPGNPEYAAWIQSVEVDPANPATYRVTWVRDFSFQFLNMSDTGRPPTDGIYVTSFSRNGERVVSGITTKISDKTVR